jgi:hypothetical protein
MEELIFFAVLIFFSIIESIARSRKQRKGGGPLPEAPGEAPPDWEQEWERQRRAGRTEQAPGPRPRLPQQGRPEVPSYDDDESFDARTARDESRSSSEAGQSFDEAAASESERRKRAESSESLIPADIWEEIAGLAREAKVELPAPAPRPKPQPKLQPKSQRRELPPQPRRVPPPRPATAKLPPLRSRPTSPPSPTAEPALEGTAAHAVHQSHVGYGTDPSERVRSAQDGLDPLARVLGRDAAAVRQQLRSQGAGALRQALILHEVLGPPAASRPDPFSE